MSKVNMEGPEISIIAIGNRDYISLTNMVRNVENGVALIERWLRNKNTIEFLGIWEEVCNANFNSTKLEGIKNEAGFNRFILSVKQWVNKTNSIRIVAKAGRYGRTYIHKDITFEFASWVSPYFKLYLVKGFEHLREEEQKQLGWDVKRNLVRINYKIHAGAIKNKLVPEKLSEERTNYIYVNETDILNVALFGMAAKGRRENNLELKGNMRDYTDISQLVCLSNLENLNVVFINEGMDATGGIEKLNAIVTERMRILTEDERIRKLK